MIKYLVSLILLILTIHSLAQDESLAIADSQPIVIDFGHDLSATSHVLQSGVCTAGIQSLACGLTTNISVGTSPWLWSDYNAANFLLRYRFFREGALTRTMQLGYAETFRSKSTVKYGDRADIVRYNYDMKVFWGILVQSVDGPERIPTRDDGPSRPLVRLLTFPANSLQISHENKIRISYHNCDTLGFICHCRIPL